MVDDEELLELVEMEVRELLDFYKFDGDGTPVVPGSALQALNGERDDIGKEAILNLLAAADEHIPLPVRDLEKPFLMPVEDVFSIPGRGTVVTGAVEAGTVNTGDELEIVGGDQRGKTNMMTTCTGVEMFKKLLDRGEAGDNIGCLLRGIKREEISRGQVIAQPGSIAACSKFSAEVYALSKEEGGRHTPFMTGYRPQFFFRTADITGNVSLPDGVEMAMPGDNLEVNVELIYPTAMNPGMTFTIREGGRTVGAGRITSVDSA